MRRADSFERPWCWERLRAGGEGDDRGWDGWTALLTQWTWVWVGSGSWWWTREAWCAVVHGVTKSQTRLSDWTEMNWTSYFLTSYFCIPVPYDEKDIFLGVLVLEGLIGFHRTIQLQLLQHYWYGHRLGLPWYWMVCLGNKQRSFCCFWDCT